MVQVIQILVFRGILFQNIYMSIKGEKYYFKTIVRIMQYDILNIDYAFEFDFSCSKWCAPKSFMIMQLLHNELKRGKNSNFKCVFGQLHDYLKD